MINLTHLSGLNVITEVLMSKRGRQEEQSPRRRCDSGSRGRSDGIVERDHEPRQIDGPPEVGKAMKHSPLEPPGEVK